MATPQQNELRRSGKTVLQPDSIESDLEGQRQPGTSGDGGPIPVDNQPGHHPEDEQDQPDMEAFVQRFGKGREPDGDGEAPSTDAEHPNGTRTVPGRLAATTVDLAGQTVRAARRFDVAELARMPFRAVGRYRSALGSRR